MKRSKVLVSLLLVFCIGVSLFAFSAAGVSAEAERLFPEYPMSYKVFSDTGRSGVYTPVYITDYVYFKTRTFLYLGDCVGATSMTGGAGPHHKIVLRFRPNTPVARYELIDNAWVYDGLVSPTLSSDGSYASLNFLENFCYVWSGVDCVYKDGTIVSPASPFPTNPPLALAVKTQLVEEITPAKLLTTIVGLLPYLLPLLIGSAAFWKCWRFLSAQLRTA